MTIYGILIGTQPPGAMSIRYIPIRSQQVWDDLQRYPGIDIIKIAHTFPNGIQVFIIYGDLRLQIMHKLSVL